MSVCMYANMYMFILFTCIYVCIFICKGSNCFTLTPSIAIPTTATALPRPQTTCLLWFLLQTQHHHNWNLTTSYGINIPCSSFSCRASMLFSTIFSSTWSNTIGNHFGIACCSRQPNTDTGSQHDCAATLETHKCHKGQAVDAQRLCCQVILHAQSGNYGDSRVFDSKSHSTAAEKALRRLSVIRLLLMHTFPTQHTVSGKWCRMQLQSYERH